MIRKYTLGFLIPPAILLAVGWFALQGDEFFGIKFLAFAGAPAAVMILGWAAVMANDIANRRADQRSCQSNSLRFVLLSLLAPVVMLLAGWGAWQASWISETVFVFGTVAPAGVTLLGWTAMVTNEVVIKLSLRRQSQE
jgi:hypothetical protein